MRFAIRAIVVGVLLAAVPGAWSAETKSGWWPFGREAETAPEQSATTAPLAAHPPMGSTAPSTTASAPTGPLGHETQMPATEAGSDNWMLSTTKTKVSWPKFQMPELPRPKRAAPAAKPVKKNMWAEPTPEPPKASPFASVKKGAHRVATGTKSAWRKTVDAVTPGDQSKSTPPQPHVAQREESPSFWQRMFGPKEIEKQPQTMPQWMAQKRLDP